MRAAAILVLLTGALIFNFCRSGYCADVTANVTVGTMVDLSTDSPTYSFGSLSSSDFDTGYKLASAGSTLTVKSNVNWQVTVKTTSANMGVSGGYTKPISDFLWKVGGGSYVAITSTEAQIATGSPTSSSNVVVDYKLLTGWATDKPGSYSVTITYKLMSS